MDEQQGTEFRAAERTEAPTYLRQGRLVESSPIEDVTVAQQRVDAQPLLQARMTEAEPMRFREGTVVDGTSMPLSEGVTMARPRIGTVVDGTPQLQRMEPLREGVAMQPRVGTVEQATPAMARESDTVGRTAVETGQSARIAAVPAQQNTNPGQSSGSGSGGAGQGFQVNPGQYSAAVSPMLAAYEQVQALSTSLSSFLPGLESQAPWGKDESGKQFAEGDKGYLKYSADTLKTLKSLPDGLKYIADGLKAMADGYEAADSSATSDLQGQDSQLQASPPPTWSPNVHIPITAQNTYEHVNQSGRH